MEIQSIPVTDSPNNDAFEGIVEAYYQTQGYITSAGKWFWVWEEGKKQRGYQDIDVLAISGTETVIISVTSNLDDKVNTQGGVANAERLEKLKNHFERVRGYLSAVDQYRWLVADQRTIKYVVAYNHAFKTVREVVCGALYASGIETIPASEMLVCLAEHASQRNLKIQNQLLRTIQLLGSHALGPTAPVQHHADGQPSEN